MIWKSSTTFFLLALMLAFTGCVPAADTDRPGASGATAGEYHLYVANESTDLVSHVVFRPGAGLELVAEIEVGIIPVEVEGPHGVGTSPDGRFWYVTLAHGQPYGSLWKFDAATDTLIGRVTLGNFPATPELASNGQFAFVANFNLHGDPLPSSVSVVHTPTMQEVARPTTCVMPHGSRLNPAGTKHYSVCMHSEQLVEIDARTFQLSARMSVAPGREGALALDDTGVMEEHANHSHHDQLCSPTWATPGVGPRAGLVYVPCNRADEVLEVDTEKWLVTRRFETGRAPYNTAITPDGRYLLATLKGEEAVAVIDLEEGRQVKRVPATRPITHGVVVSADGRYAFVSNEAVGSTPGTLDVIDLSRLERVASAALRYQPGGIGLIERQ
ncbi:MAG: YncE family protein [Longimicrobiaceae bacterium]